MKSFGKDDVKSQRKKKKKKDRSCMSKVYDLYLAVQGSHYHKRHTQQ